MSDTVIRADKISKMYHIGKRQSSYQTLRDTISDAFLAPLRRASRLLRGQATGAAELDEVVWVLQDVSFEVKQGEVVGVIGKNGAGKSTLLKILSRITEPSSGYAEIHGRVGSLLEVGTGFHPELTGRENIYLNGAILGMKRSEIIRKFDEMVAFSEVEKFIDTPVKHYSSGMYLRLAFAVAAHLEPEILLVDEVLAVGDADFQKKCLGKMRNIAGEGRTVFLVSHNMAAIDRLCSRTIWIDKGHIQAYGATQDVIEKYLSSQAKNCASEVSFPESLECNRLQMKSVRILSGDEQPTAVIDYRQPFKIEIAYDIKQPVKGSSVICRLTDLQGNIVFTSWDTDTTNLKESIREPNHYISTCTLPGGMLRPGRYALTIGAMGENVLTFHEHVLSFEISPVGYYLNRERVGIITPLFDWEVKRNGQRYIE